MEQFLVDRRRAATIVLWGLAAFGLLFLVAAFVMLPWVESDLTDRVEQDVVAAGFGGIAADFSGQDGTLYCAGEVDNPRELRDAAVGVYGVRQIDLGAACGLVLPEVTSTSTQPGPTTPRTTRATTTTSEAVPTLLFAASVEPGRVVITLSGSVDTEEQRAVLVDAASAAFGLGSVDDELAVADNDDSEGNADVAAVAAVIAAMPHNLVSAEAGIDDGVYFRGRYFDDEAKALVDEVIDEAAFDSTTVEILPREEATSIQAGQLEQRLNALVGATPIPFNTGSSRLSDEGAELLDEVAALSRTFGGVTIAVNGHTDGDGTTAANQSLSQSRAEAVSVALVERGVPEAQLIAVGFGESQPIAPNDTPENKARNRRVVFSVAVE